MRWRTWLAIVSVAFPACAGPPPARYDGGLSADQNSGDPGSPGSAADAGADGGPPTSTADASSADAGAFVDTQEIDDYLTAQMNAAHAPGMAVAIVKGDHVGWSKGYGLADIDAGRPVTADTLFLLASISKTVTSVALMRILEDPSRHLSLDDDVGASLPFTVRNPSYPGTPITFRMLLTHTSSFDGAPDLESFTVDGDPTESLHDFLADAVTKSESWSAAKPGTAYSYSNIGASLAGYLVEAISGQTLEEYCRAQIFAPLGMTETSWFLRGLDPTHVAMPYELASGTYQAQGSYGVLFYPATELRTSANQLARFLIMFAQHGRWESARILSAATVDEMRRVQFPELDGAQGLIWYYTDDDSTRVLGHSGGYFGVSTDMYFDPATGAGYVILMNGGQMLANYADDAANAAIYALNVEMMGLANSLP